MNTETHQYSVYVQYEQKSEFCSVNLCFLKFASWNWSLSLYRIYHLFYHYSEMSEGNCWNQLILTSGLFFLSLRYSQQHFSRELNKYTYLIWQWRHSLIGWPCKYSSLKFQCTNPFSVQGNLFSVVCCTQWVHRFWES